MQNFLRIWLPPNFFMMDSTSGLVIYETVDIMSSKNYHKQWNRYMFTINADQWYQMCLLTHWPLGNLNEILDM